MRILNINEIRPKRLDAPTIASNLAPEAVASPSAISTRAGQRRMRDEAVGFQALKAVPDELVLAMVKYGNNPDGIPALLYATKMGDLDAVKLLVDYGADPLTRDLAKNGALYYSLLSKNNQLVEYFLNMGLDPNEGDNGYHCGKVWNQSIASMDSKSFELLIAHGLRLDSAFYSSPFSSPSIACITAGNLDLLKLILNKGGDVPRDAGILLQNSDPVLMAIASDFPGKRKEKMECLKWLVQIGILDLKNLKNLNTQGVCWIQSTYPEFLEYVIDNGYLKINEKILYDYYYPIHMVLQDPSLLQVLINKGADANQKCGSGAYGRTPLHNAFNLESVKILIANGANVNAVDELGKTPLFLYQANINHPASQEIIRLLIDHGAIAKG